VLAILVAVLLLALGRYPMLPAHNAFYALASVSFAAFLMAIWAKPSNNKSMILPGVLRFSIPMAVTIAVFGLVVYVVFLHFTGNGSFDLGYDFYHGLYDGYGSSPMWSNWDGFWEHMSPGNESFEEVTARNAMLIFLILSGISQLLFIYPLAKFYSVDGAVSRDLKPTLLAVLLFLLVAAIYEVPQVAMGVASLTLFPTEYYLMIIGFVVVWFFFTAFLLKNRHMRKVSDAAESAYQKSLEAETGKDE